MRFAIFEGSEIVERGDIDRSIDLIGAISRASILAADAGRVMRLCIDRGDGKAGARFAIDGISGEIVSLPFPVAVEATVDPPLSMGAALARGIPVVIRRVDSDSGDPS